MKSPCLKVCMMNPDNELCRGCFRTLDEIARWSLMTDEERERILKDLPGRASSASSSSDVPKISVPPLA